MNNETSATIFRIFCYYYFKQSEQKSGKDKRISSYSWKKKKREKRIVKGEALKIAEIVNHCWDKLSELPVLTGLMTLGKKQTIEMFKKSAKYS